jgi:hypothetical protein
LAGSSRPRLPDGWQAEDGQAKAGEEEAEDIGSDSKGLPAAGPVHGCAQTPFERAAGEGQGVTGEVRDTGGDCGGEEDGEVGPNSTQNPYDLRRSAVRNLIHAGVAEITAMRITGHRSRETFRRYAIEDPSEIAAAIERVEAYVTPRMKRRNRIVPFSKRGGNAGRTRAGRAK